MQINWIGVMASVNIAITTLNVGYTYAVRTEWIETETTQERVLETLKSHSEQIARIRDSTGDRWRKAEELRYQISQEKEMMDHKEFQHERDRIQDLQIKNMTDMHIFGHYGRYNERHQ